MSDSTGFTADDLRKAVTVLDAAQRRYEVKRLKARNRRRWQVVAITVLAALLALLLAGCTDTIAPNVGATGEWAGDVVNLTADGQPTQILSDFKPLAVELHLLEDTRGIRGVILSTLIEDQALKGVRDGDRLVLVAGNQSAVLHVNQHGDEMSGTLTVIFGLGTETIQRVYRVRLRR